MVETAASKITKVYDGMKAISLEKNRRYGNSALEPIGIFCKESSDIQIRSRLDDKLARVKNSTELRKNDVCDIIGYLVLLLVDNEWIEFEDLID